MTTWKHCFWLMACSPWGKGHTGASYSKRSQAGKKGWTEPRYHVSFVFYVSEKLWGQDRGDEVSCSEHCRTVSSWPLYCLPGVAHPLWEAWLKRLKWGQSLIFPHSLVLPGNSLGYFSCSSNREGRYSLIAWTWEVRKGLDSSCLLNTEHFSQPHKDCLISPTHVCATDRSVSGEWQLSLDLQ